MMKKYLILAVGILFVIVIALVAIQSVLNKKPPTSPSFLTPTPVAGKKGRGISVSNPNSTPTPTITTSDKQLIEKAQQNPQSLSKEELQQIQGILKKSLPVETADFNLDRSSRLDKYVLYAKSDNAYPQFDLWLEKNSQYKPVLADDQVIRSKQPISELHEALDVAEKTKLSPEKQAIKDADTFMFVLNSLLNLPQGLSNSFLNQPPQPTPTPTQIPPTQPPVPTPTPLSSSPPTGRGSYQYYSQTDYDTSPLPNGFFCINLYCCSLNYLLS